jgi:hypothetical protein
MAPPRRCVHVARVGDLAGAFGFSQRPILPLILDPTP